jgi:hypothetical protein
VLLELQVHVVLAATILLDRDDDPVAEALRLVRVELDVDLGVALRPSLSAATMLIMGTFSLRAMSFRPLTT